MLGVGGAIINYPLLLYIPVLFGFTGFNAHQVSGIVENCFPLIYPFLIPNFNIPFSSVSLSNS